MLLTQDEFVSRIAERVVDNKDLLSRSMRQRRNQAVDLMGIEYTRQGGAGVPASFYLSISPDMVYMERLEFKLIIQPFTSTSGVSTGVTIPQLQPTSLTITGGQITPNPHTHQFVGHTHGVSPDIIQTPTTASDFRVYVEGVDISAYLMAQHGVWIDGEGVYPSLDINKNFDLLEVASDMYGEGRTTEANMIVRSGYKRVDITSDSLFSATLTAYIKHSHMNR